MPADLDRTLTALADPTRRAIVEQLRRQSLRPSELADTLAISRPAISRHLRVLREAGLVDQEVSGDDARARPIQLRGQPLADLRGWLQDLEGFWHEQLAAFKAHAEKPKGRRR